MKRKGARDASYMGSIKRVTPAKAGIHEQTDSI